MPVLLFTQTGDARPKCEGEANPTERHGHPRMLFYGHRLTNRQWDMQHAADRWWLVETSDADAGRRVIEAARLRGKALGGGYAGHASDGGRILAHGGKR